MGLFTDYLFVPLLVPLPVILDLLDDYLVGGIEATLEKSFFPRATGDEKPHDYGGGGGGLDWDGGI